MIIINPSSHSFSHACLQCPQFPSPGYHSHSVICYLKSANKLQKRWTLSYLDCFLQINPFHTDLIPGCRLNMKHRTHGKQILFGYIHGQLISAQEVSLWSSGAKPLNWKATQIWAKLWFFKKKIHRLIMMVSLKCWSLQAWWEWLWQIGRTSDCGAAGENKFVLDRWSMLPSCIYCVCLSATINR